MPWICPACRFNDNHDSSINCVCGYNPESVDSMESIIDGQLPIARFSIRAGFRRLCVLLWNGFMTVFCLCMLLFFGGKIADGDHAILIMGFFILCILLIPTYVRGCSSAFAGDICIYQDRIVQFNFIRNKEIKFCNAFFMVHYPTFAGGKVLYFTNSNYLSPLKRLLAVLLLKNVMLFHLWMLPDDEELKLIRLLSDLSARTESDIRQPGIFKSFYPYNAKVQI